MGSARYYLPAVALAIARHNPTHGCAWHRLWCCVHLVLVRWRYYEPVVVRGGSWALLGLASYWAVQRLT